MGIIGTSLYSHLDKSLTDTQRNLTLGMSGGISLSLLFLVVALKKE